MINTAYEVWILKDDVSAPSRILVEGNKTRTTSRQLAEDRARLEIAEGGVRSAFVIRCEVILALSK